MIIGYSIVFGVLLGLVVAAIGYIGFVMRWVGWFLVVPALIFGCVCAKQKYLAEKFDIRSEPNAFDKIFLTRVALIVAPSGLAIVMGAWFVIIIVNRFGVI